MHERKWQRISELEAEVRSDEEALRAKKRLVNNLCAEVGAPPTYGAHELEPIMRDLAPGLSLFDVLPLTGCVKRVLGERHRYGLGPVAVEDIFGTLLRGGFDFSTVSANGRRAQLRALTTALSRNPNMCASCSSLTDGMGEADAPTPPAPVRERPPAADLPEETQKAA